jgi:hypothetical protein
MINKENLTDYIHQKMNYKKEVEVTSFKVFDSVISVKVNSQSIYTDEDSVISVNLNKALGEIINKQKFLNWLHQNRNQKIEEIIGEYHD